MTILLLSVGIMQDFLNTVENDEGGKILCAFAKTLIYIDIYIKSVESTL